jgi:hypothetical protein
VIPLLSIYPKECKTGYNRDTCTPVFITTLFTIPKLWKQPRCPTTDEWIMKLWYIYTVEYYSAARNNGIGFEGKWVKLEEIMLSEVSQSKAQKMHVSPHTGMKDTKINVYTKTSVEAWSYTN